jgi:hypothetical protein
VDIDFLNKCKAGPEHAYHGAQVNGVVFKVFPELKVDGENLSELQLDLVKLVLRDYHVFEIQASVIELFVELHVLLFDDLAEPG